MEVVLAFHLKGDTPSEVIEVLEYMIREDPLNASAPPFELPDHPFFQDDPSAGFYLYRQDWIFLLKWTKVTLPISRMRICINMDQAKNIASLSELIFLSTGF